MSGAKCCWGRGWQGDVREGLKLDQREELREAELLRLMERREEED